MLFADLVGSTALASSEDPEYMRALLERFYEAMTDEIAATGGTVEKFAGDAVMAVFGVPVAHEDHAERALHAALAMRARLERLFGGRLQLRIGVNTGEVVAGSPTAGSSFVSGDAVNVAARLEQGASPGEILVGPRTAALAAAAFDLSPARTIEAKGKEGGIPAYGLIGVLATARPRGIVGDAFLGRARDLEELEQSYDRVASSGAPATVAIVGDPGVGKSRLLDEMGRRLAVRSPAPVLRTGRCLSYGRGLTYRPMADVLRSELGLQESDPPADVLDRLGDRAILGLALGLDVAADLHPLVVRERFAQAWIDVLEERAAQAPVVLVIEDLHWAEEPLLELLRSLRQRLTGRLLIVTAARPEAANHIAADTRIELEPLSTGDAGEMIRTVLGGDLPAPARDLVLARAEGNPFFIEELLATLIDRRIIARSDGQWSIQRTIDERDLPDTVQAVLASRIDLLPETEKRALQAASVVGRLFGDATVRALVAPAEPNLAVLEQRAFAQRTGDSSIGGGTRYAFRHQLTREVAYASLPKSDRGRLHAAVGRFLERNPDDARAPFLAHHFEQSVRDDYAVLAWGDRPDELDALRARAVHWLRVAAQLAASSYDIDAAVAMYERAIELAADDPTRFELWRALAGARSQRYDARGFVEASEQAIALAPDEAEVTRLHAELALRSATAWLAWTPPLAREQVESWIDRALESSRPDSPDRAMALVARAWHGDRDIDTAGEAVAIAERVGDPELLGWALRVQTIAAMQAGRYDEAAASSQRILDLLDSITDPGNRETLVENTSLRLAAATGRFDDARRYADLVAGLVADLTPHNRLHGVSYALEIEELAAGWERIRELEPRTVRAVDENRATPCVRNARALLVCALAETALGDMEAAQRFEQLASSLGIEGHDRELTAPRLRMALLRGDRSEARRLLAAYGRPTMRFMFDMAGAMTWLDAAAELGLREDVEREAPALAVPGTSIQPFALRALGIVRDDPELVEQAARRFDELGHVWYARHGPDPGRLAEG